MNNKTKFEIHPSLEDFDIHFPLVSFSDDFPYLLVEILFEIKPLFLSNQSLLSDFDRFKEIPGHEYTKYLD
ncbi:MAG: hypothetical protein ACTSPC_10415, partial [Candidatus Heimdallarchaeota archaeon]